VTVNVTRDEEPLSGLLVTIESDNAGTTEADRTRARSTDEEGVIVVSMPAGNVVARVVDPITQAPHDVSGVLTSDGLALDLILPSASHGAVSGSVVDGGSGVAGAVVKLVQLTPDGGPGPLMGEATAAADGTFGFTGVPIGAYEVWAWHPSQYRPGKAAVTVVGLETAPASVALTPAAAAGAVAVHGVIEETGADAVGGFVALSVDNFWPYGDRHAQLDATGRTTFVGVPAGGVATHGADPHGLGWEDGQVAAGNTTPITLRISPNRRWFPIEITGEDDVARQLHSEGQVTDDDFDCRPFCGVFAQIDDEWFPPPGTGYVHPDGREVTIGPRHTEAGLEISRRVFVPPAGGYVRYLDVIHNPGAASITARYHVEQGHEGAWTTSATSSGDAVFDAADHYVVAHDTDGESPEVVLVSSGADAPVAHGDPSSLFEEEENFTYYGPVWPALTVAPGQTVILMHFVIERPAGELAQAVSAAEALLVPDATALSYLTEAEKTQIINFQIE
jgi:hypothetical protein